MSESRLEAFKIAVNGVEIFDYFIKLTKDNSNPSKVVLLRHTNGLLSICIPRQLLFAHQPDGAKIYRVMDLFLNVRRTL